MNLFTISFSRANSTRKEGASMADETPEGKIIILDFGNQSRKKIRRLRRGKGPLMDDVKEAIQEVEQSGAIPAGSPVVVAVVKQRRRKMFGLW
jgi:hypothetical protein